MTIVFSILALLVLAVALVLILALQKPSSFQVQRKTTVRASPAQVQAQIESFHAWQNWSPWEGLDPAMQRTHSGAASGVGAKYHWLGNKKVGEGWMLIDKSDPGIRTEIQLEFIKPFAGSNRAVFEYKPQGDQTEVVWTMTGPMLFISKIMDVVVGMDKMIGNDFEKGLAKLKAHFG